MGGGGEAKERVVRDVGLAGHDVAVGAEQRAAEDALVAGDIGFQEEEQLVRHRGVRIFQSHRP